jgi:hypothetical protein
MFVEGEVEIKVKDRSAMTLDDHELKLWIQSAFKDMSCYRISNLQRDASERTVRVVVALKIANLPDDERRMIETHPHDLGLLRSFMERMFGGKGVCRCIGEPKLRSN